MARRRTTPERAPGRATPERRAEASAAIVRRAPFSDNPEVGIRGQRTQQRILDAALQVFAEAGYHASGIDRITKAAGCSRASFYQYFAGKEDVFRHLAGRVARQMDASTELLGTVTADAAGWATMRAPASLDARSRRGVTSVLATWPCGRKRPSRGDSAWSSTTGSRS